jgi:DNA/RNA-binding domain of Phe-tRNA-synthetase-like protein
MYKYSRIDFLPDIIIILIHNILIWGFLESGQKITNQSHDRKGDIIILMTSDMLKLSNHWRNQYPGAQVGILVVENVKNSVISQALDEEKKALQISLCEQYQNFDRNSLKAIREIQVYNNFYRNFRKTYHLQLQLESIVFKGKSIPSVSPFVDVMFMAEMKHLLLTSGHDLDLVHLPVTIKSALGTESFTSIKDKSQELKTGDMFIEDQLSILSSIIYGPDLRTQIRPSSKNILYTVYAPEGITETMLTTHLNEIKFFISKICVDARITICDQFPKF